MALQTSGQISHSDIAAEFSHVGQMGLSADGAAMIGKSAGTQIKETDFYGASAFQGGVPDTSFALGGFGYVSNDTVEPDPISHGVNSSIITLSSPAWQGSGMFGGFGVFVSFGTMDWSMGTPSSVRTTFSFKHSNQSNYNLMNTYQLWLARGITGAFSGRTYYKRDNYNQAGHKLPPGYDPGVKITALSNLGRNDPGYLGSNSWVSEGSNVKSRTVSGFTIQPGSSHPHGQTIGFGTDAILMKGTGSGGDFKVENWAVAVYDNSIF